VTGNIPAMRILILFGVVVLALSTYAQRTFDVTIADSTCHDLSRSAG
jgi:hypothetical protein